LSLDRSACSWLDKNDAKSTFTKIFENFKELVKDDEVLTEKTETPTTPTEKIEDSNNSITCLSGEDCETKGRDQQEKNEVKARIYFEKGCEFENGSACWMAAGYYEEGLKVEKDLNKAKKLHQKSCDNGFNYGCKALSEYPYPSFDCAKASNFVEKLICEDVDLSKLDNEIATEYRIALKGNDPKKVKNFQRAWIKERNICTDIYCIKKAYEKRIVELKEETSVVSLKSFNGEFSSEDGTLNIKQTGNSFKFEYFVSAGMQTGEISGTAKIKGNTAVFKEEECTLVFELKQNSINVLAENCNQYGGVGVTFGGEYK